jgi:mitogen-activated protein kinase organizer 1
MPLQILEEAKDSVTGVAIRGHLIVTGSVDGFARTYDIRQGELRTDFFDRELFPVLIPSPTNAHLSLTTNQNPSPP